MRCLPEAVRTTRIGQCDMFMELFLLSVVTDQPDPSRDTAYRAECNRLCNSILDRHRRDNGEHGYAEADGWLSTAGR